jgi:hypothetical protein
MRRWHACAMLLGCLAACLADAHYTGTSWTGTPTGLTLLFQEPHIAGALTAVHALPTGPYCAICSLPVVCAQGELLSFRHRSLIARRARRWTPMCRLRYVLKNKGRL